MSGPNAPVPVLQVVLSLNAGGTERLVVELVRRTRRDFPAAVCCLDEAGLWAGELESEGIAIHALNRSEGFHVGLGRAIARAAKRHRARVIHCHHYSPFVYGVLARLWRPACRVVYTEHGRVSDAPPSAKRRAANLLFSKLPSAVFTVSSELRQHIIDEGFSPAAVDVIYNGIAVGSAPTPATRVEMRARLGVSDETIVIGTIARLDPVKDLGTAIRAVGEASRHAPVMLVIVGDGPERSALEEGAARTGVPDRVRFLGHRDDARAWLAACDVYVNSSISEGISLTILEAMAARLPVVVTHVGGTPEIVDESCGRLVASRDTSQLASALTELARDPALRTLLGHAGRRRVEERFTIERMVQEYRDVYRRLA